MFVSCGLLGSLPSKKEIQKITNPISSSFYARDGELLGSYYVENREYLDSTEISKYFKSALIATEDHRFYKHSGIDYRSLFRVLIKSILLQQKESGGGSTITQQLVKNIFPRKHYLFCETLINKFREIQIAKRVEECYSKDHIIWLYSSTVSFGDRTFGLKSASRKFFNKPPDSLLIEEAATLVGVLKATSFYNPRKYPQRAKLRRNIVLNKMVRYSYFKASQVGELLEKNIVLDYQAGANSEELGSYFKQYLLKEFDKLSNELRRPDGLPYSLYHDGLKVYTTMDYKLQMQAVNYRNRHMLNLQKQFENSWKGKAIYGSNNSVIDDYIRKDKNFQTWKSKGLSPSEAIDSFNTEEERTFWNWEMREAKKSTRIDSIKHYLKLLHASMFAIDPDHGDVLVYLAGNDYFTFPFDNILAKRQVGSLFKPIVYLAAMEQGVNPCDYYKNELINYDEYDDWRPENANFEYGGYISVNEALAHSVNTVSVQLLFDVGISNVVKFSRELGINSKLDEVPSIVLGTSDISLFEMVTAYARIINRKHKVNPNAILKIEDKEGKVLFERDSSQFEEISLINEDSFDKVLSMMYKVSREGTGRTLYNNYRLPTTVFSKTGTTQNQSDGWFIAASNNIVIGAWVGTEDRRMHFPSLSSGSASKTTLPMVGALMEVSLKGYKNNFEFIRPQFFDCPNVLSDEQYEMYKKELAFDSLAQNNSHYGGWLKRLFMKKSSRLRLNDRYQEDQIKKQLNLLKAKRKEELVKMDEEIRMWEVLLNGSSNLERK